MRDLGLIRAGLSVPQLALELRWTTRQARHKALGLIDMGKLTERQRRRMGAVGWERAFYGAKPGEPIPQAPEPGNELRAALEATLLCWADWMSDCAGEIRATCRYSVSQFLIPSEQSEKASMANTFEGLGNRIADLPPEQRDAVNFHFWLADVYPHDTHPAAALEAAIQTLLARKP